MKILYTGFFVFFGLCSFYGQKNDVEDLINSFYKDIIPTNFEYYNLLDESLVVEFDVWYLNDIIDETKLTKEIPHFKKEDFEDSEVKINWKTYNLEKAKIYSLEKIPKFRSAVNHHIFIDRKMSRKYYDSIVKNKKYNEIILRGNPKWNKDKRNRKFQKVVFRQSQKIRDEDQDYYRFSNPIFSKGKEYAVIYFRDCCHSIGYLYKYSNKQWENILSFYFNIYN